MNYVHSLVLASLLLTLLGVSAAAETPPAPKIPDASRCQVPGRTPEELEALRRFVAERGPASRTRPAPTAVPQGSPAEPATRAAITNVVDTFFACNAAGRMERAYLLVSDANLVRFIDDPDEAVAYVAGLAEATPAPDAPGERAIYAGPWDVQMLPDGRVAAAVWIDSEDEHPTRGVTTIWLFAFENSGWRLDDTISEIFVELTPTPKQKRKQRPAGYERVNVADIVGWPEVAPLGTPAP